jgi:predicted ATP-grasp superfamily ATP-dependent carboligase
VITIQTAEESSSSVIIVGGSARAAAFSARRAGLVPWCLDLFADADLTAVATAVTCPVADFPLRLPELLRDSPIAPIMYTGGLENYPSVVAELGRRRPLWGNDAGALHGVRDPFFVARILAETGLRCPTLGWVPLSGSFLRKPLKSAGGTHIRLGHPSDPPVAGHYFQQFVTGPAYSVVYCAYRDVSALLGVTMQRCGEAWLHARPFQYCGSIGPVEMPSTVENVLMRLGDVLRVASGLRGLFGVDFVLHEGQPWLIEINPRYTASIEVLEYATGLKALDIHRSAFEGTTAGAPSSTGTANRCVGKAILFAPDSFVFPDRGPWTGLPDPLRRPEFADIPQPGSHIESGWPIMTLLAESTTANGCEMELRRRAAAIYGTLGIAHEGGDRSFSPLS